MKKTNKACTLTALMLALILFVVPALAETGKQGKWNVYYAKDVDLSSIAESDGRLKGTIQTFRPNADPRVLRVDCPVPVSFTPEQQQLLIVEYKKFGKRDMENALKGIGTDSRQGKIQLYNSSSDSRAVLFQTGDLHDLFTSNPQKSVITEKPLDANQPKYAEMTAAIHTSSSLLEALGFVPYEAAASAEHLSNPPVFGPFLLRSDAKQVQEEQRRQSARDRLRYGIKENDYASLDYTMIHMTVLVRGLPVYTEFTWPTGTAREPNAITGNSTWIRIAVKDNGTIVDAYLGALPVEKSAVPLQAPLHTWQEALKEYIATYYTSRTKLQDVTTINQATGQEVTEYATYSILTEIKPVYMSSEKNMYAPAWCFVTERHLAKDDTFIDMQVACLDAATLTNPTLLAIK